MGAGQEVLGQSAWGPSSSMIQCRLGGLKVLHAGAHGSIAGAKVDAGWEVLDVPPKECSSTLSGAEAHVILCVLGCFIFVLSWQHNCSYSGHCPLVSQCASHWGYFGGMLELW